MGVLMSSVEDVKRGITRNLIKETRVMELRREALNSNKLKMHFEDNPQELQLLKHAASKKLLRVQPPPEGHPRVPGARGAEAESDDPRGVGEAIAQQQREWE